MTDDHASALLPVGASRLDAAPSGAPLRRAGRRAGGAPGERPLPISPPRSRRHPDRTAAASSPDGAKVTALTLARPPERRPLRAAETGRVGARGHPARPLARRAEPPRAGREAR